MKTSLSSLAVCLLIPLVLIVILHLWPDEQPLSETSIYQSLQTPSSTPNSWLLGVFGFMSDGDIFISGSERIVAYKQNKTYISDQKLEITEQRQACERNHQDCLHILHDEFLIAATEHPELLENYSQLYTASDFSYVLSPWYTLPYPEFSNILTLQQIWYARIQTSSDLLSEMQWVYKDLSYWRRVLRGSNTFLAKMVAVAGINNAIEMISSLLEKYDQAALTDLPDIEVLKHEEVSMLSAIQFEMSIDYAVMHNLDRYIRESDSYRVPGLNILLPYKPVATFNRHQQNYAAVLKMADLQAEELGRVYTTLPPRLHTVSRKDLILNGKGVWILELADASDQYLTYSFRVFDLQGKIALVNLKKHILSSSPGTDVIQNLLDQSSIRNPYNSGEPARWRQETGEILFDTQPGIIDKNRIPLKISLPISI